MYSQKKKLSSPEANSPWAVNYFRHFPTSFLKPYGKAEERLSEDMVLRRLSHINCEWLRRPDFGSSEFAETILQNMSLLSENESEYINQGKLSEMQGKLSSFLKVLEKMNSKNTTTDKVTPADVKRFLQHIC